jgi:hypothetical protein
MHYSPGHEPGQQGDLVQPLVAYTISWTGTGAQQLAAARTTVDDLRALASQAAGPTHWATYADPEDLAGAIIFPASRHSVCVCRGRTLATRCCSVWRACLCNGDRPRPRRRPACACAGLAR